MELVKQLRKMPSVVKIEEIILMNPCLIHFTE